MEILFSVISIIFLILGTIALFYRGYARSKFINDYPGKNLLIFIIILLLILIVLSILLLFGIQITSY